MLALALPAPLDAREREAVWLSATADLAVAAAVRREVDALGSSARRRVFALLVQRARGAAPAHRRVLRAALLRRWSMLPASAATRWRAFALVLLLGGERRALSHGGELATLAQQAAAAHAATGLLSLTLGAPADAVQAWRNAAAQALVEAGAPAPRGPAAGLAPATPRTNLQLALRVRRVGPMQRPLLVWAWLRAVERSGLSGHAGTGDALHQACLVLDVPLPDTLA
jgi:hypothetical protein